MGITDVTKSDGEPHDELTRLCDAMTADLPDGVRAVVMVDLPGHAGMVAVGYEDDDEIVETVRRHLQALQLAKLGAPTEQP